MSTDTDYQPKHLNEDVVAIGENGYSPRHSTDIIARLGADVVDLDALEAGQRWKAAFRERQDAALRDLMRDLTVGASEFRRGLR